MNKKLIYACLTIVLFLMQQTINAQVTIGADKSPAPYSVLEVISTATSPGGMRIPQVASLAERNAIEAKLTADPTTNGNGLTIYYLPTQEEQYWNGSEWKTVVTDAANGVTKNGTTIELGGTMTAGKTITLATGRPLSFQGDNTNSESNTNVAFIGRKAIKINDGNQANGKILVSDLYGNGSWKAPEELNIATNAVNGVTLNKTTNSIELGGTMTDSKTITLAAGRPLSFQGDNTNSESNTNVSFIGRKAIKINDGNQADGKILVSDFSGNGSWKAPEELNIATNAVNGVTLNKTTNSIELGGTMTDSKTITLATGRPLSFQGDNTNSESNTNVSFIGRKALKINDGNQARGKVLVSDLYGNVAWQSPDTELNIVGPIKYVNGTAPFSGKVLTADENGIASWQNPNVLPTPVATIGDGVTFNPYTETNTLTKSGYISDDLWRDTGSRINIPPGKWIIMVTTLVTLNLSDANMNNTSSMWVRSSFRRVGENAVRQGDFIGTYLISGVIQPNMQWQMLTGYVIINNTTTNTINYEYVVGNSNTFESKNTAATSSRWPKDLTISNFGGRGAGENSIVAFGIVQ